jgi:hypothetical protein
MRVLLRLREAEARRQREREASARRRVRQLSEQANLPGRVPTDEEIALQYAEVARLREQNERRERLSPSLLEDDDEPVVTVRHTSPKLAAVAPTSQTAESANVGAGLRPAPTGPSETTKSSKRSEDVVEKKEAGNQEPEVKSEPTSPKHSLFVLQKPEPGVREDGIAEWGA